MTMTPDIRKLTLTSHITASVGWLGALAVFLAHAVASVISQDEQMVRAASLAMELSAWFVILPLCLVALLTGLIQALGTPWGLFRHYWVLAKLLLTVVAITVLLLKLAPISHLASAAAETTFSGGDLSGLRASLLVHAGGGLVVLLAIAALAVYKPYGMTRYGVRKQADAGTASDFKSVNRAPRWVQVFAIVFAVLVLLVVIMMLGGGHGPGAHL